MKREESEHASRREQNLAALIGEQREKRSSRDGALRSLLGEHRRLGDVAPNVKGDGDQRDAEQERHAPRPVKEGRTRFADRGVDDEEDQAAENQAAA